jgi:hypothetical protein
MKKIAIFAAIMVVGAGVAMAGVLNVPFFLDSQSVNFGANTGVTGQISVKELSGSDQTLTVVYTALDATDNPTNQTVTFALGAFQQVRWNPVQDNTAESALGGSIGNLTIAGRVAGSAVITSGGAMAGTYGEIDHQRQGRSLHVLRAS